jgi:hypothetical protein
MRSPGMDACPSSTANLFIATSARIAGNVSGSRVEPLLSAVIAHSNPAQHLFTLTVPCLAVFLPSYATSFKRLSALGERALHGCRAWGLSAGIYSEKIFPTY